MAQTTFDEFMWKMLEAFPKATFTEDDGGQLIISTGLRSTGYDEVVDLGTFGEEEMRQEKSDVKLADLEGHWSKMKNSPGYRVFIDGSDEPVWFGLQLGRAIQHIVLEKAFSWRIEARHDEVWVKIASWDD